MAMNAVKAKAISIVKDLVKIITLIPILEEPLSQCFEFYNIVVNDYNLKGVEALENGDAKTAIEILSKAAIGAYARLREELDRYMGKIC